MNPKKWTIVFTLFILSCLIFIMTVNVIVDPYYYFRSQSGDCYEADDLGYLRETKAEHIKHFPDKYDAFLVGGSKAGALRTEKLKEMTGDTYYNTYVLAGNFQDYYYFAKHIINNSSAKKLLLHISTSELRGFTRESKGDMYKLPALLKGESKIPEYMTFLFKNVSASYDAVTRDLETDPHYPAFPTGERDLTKYYQYMSAHRDTYYDRLFRGDMKTAEKRLMTDRKGVKGVVDLNIQSLKDIKSLCEKNGVELEVVFGSVFIGEMAILETESFYEFLLRTVDITGGLWNFNTYNDLAYNPYNYYNTNHYLYEIGDLMIETMNGGEAPEGFGIYLTPENISSYIEERKSKRKELQEYYKQNNKFPLYDFDHETNYKRDEKLSYMEKTGNRK